MQSLATANKSRHSWRRTVYELITAGCTLYKITHHL